MTESRADKLRLDLNENLLGCSRKVQAALRRLSSQEIAMYPEKFAAAKRLAGYFGVREEEIVLTAGIDDAIRLLSDIFIERGRTVLLVEPTFPMYRFHAEQREARICALHYTENMDFPMREVLRELRRSPEIFFLPNPNNPTGSLLGENDLRRILDVAPRTLVVIDEAYFEFSRVTALQWIRERKNLAVTRTFSKAAGLAGLRIGCICAHRELAETLRSAQDPFPIGVAALVAAEAAVEDRAFIRRVVAEIMRSRKFLSAELARRGVRVFPSAANFLLADFGSRGPKILSQLVAEEILIRDQSRSFGRPGVARITVGTLAQMKQFLRALDPLL